MSATKDLQKLLNKSNQKSSGLAVRVFVRKQFMNSVPFSVYFIVYKFLINATSHDIELCLRTVYERFSSVHEQLCLKLEHQKFKPFKILYISQSHRIEQLNTIPATALIPTLGERQCRY